MNQNRPLTSGRMSGHASERNAGHFSGRMVMLAILLASASAVLGGCAPSMEPIDENATGWFDRYFIYPFSLLIKFFADQFGGNYGLSLIVMTLLIRIGLLPLMMKQYRSQKEMQQKMALMQPELKAIQEKYKDKKDAESQTKMQQEMMQLYQKHRFNPLSVGCLPLLIQMPFLLGFYYAIMRTPEISEHSFLWFDLGEKDLIMPFVAAAIYFAQVKVSQALTPPSATQPNQLAMLMYLSPVMIGLFSFTTPAALPLYWAVGGLFLIFQTWLFKRIYG